MHSTDPQHNQSNTTFFPIGLTSIFFSFAAFAGILFGYDTGTISGIIQMNDWLELFGERYQPDDPTKLPFRLLTSRESLIVSILSAGTFFGESSCILSWDVRLMSFV